MNTEAVAWGMLYTLVILLFITGIYSVCCGCMFPTCCIKETTCCAWKTICCFVPKKKKNKKPTPVPGSELVV